MLRRTRAMIGGLIAALLLPLAVATVPPAAADHTWGYEHWRVNQYPAVTTPGCYFNWCDLITDAAYYWQNRGFWRGYTPPLPRHDVGTCSAVTGYINVCFKNYGDPLLGNLYGRTYVFAYAGDPAHQSGSLVVVCGNCGSFVAHQSMRHEMGHALGLGHTADSSCVMHATAQVLGETCSHDVAALDFMSVARPGHSL